MEEKYLLVERVSEGKLEIRQYFRTKESAADNLKRWVNNNLSGHFFVAEIIMRPTVDYTINIEEV